MFTRLLLLAGAFVGAGCVLSSQTAPPLAGPSELALSLAVSASPDVVTQDGRSQSILAMTARDANGRPVRGVTLRLAMFVGDVNVDYGTLTSKTISTDDAGFASALYTAPMAPPPAVTADTLVRIQVLATGSDFANVEPRFVNIRLTRPGVILPPNPPLVPSFFFSPLQPHESESVQFDASASTGAIVSHAWSFGDGAAGAGARPTHRYAVSGTYNVVLTLTDDRGIQASSAPVPINVLAAANPVAAFAVSPADPGVNDDVYFDGSASSVPSGRSIVSYSWNFGDGSIGAGRTASHKYARANTYTIVLTVADNTGRTGVTSKSLQVK